MGLVALFNIPSTCRFCLRQFKPVVCASLPELWDDNYLSRILLESSEWPCHAGVIKSLSLDY